MWMPYEKLTHFWLRMWLQNSVGSFSINIDRFSWIDYCMSICFSQIIQEFNQQLFMQENPVFHKAHDFQFQPSEYDTVRCINIYAHMNLIFIHLHPGAFILRIGCCWSDILSLFQTQTHIDSNQPLVFPHENFPLLVLFIFYWMLHFSYRMWLKSFAHFKQRNDRMTFFFLRF